jgi:hypothetical protein
MQDKVNWRTRGPLPKNNNVAAEKNRVENRPEIPAPKGVPGSRLPTSNNREGTHQFVTNAAKHCWASGIGVTYTVMVSRRISRFVALLLLLWTAVDLSIPSICRGEDPGSNMGQGASVVQRQDTDLSQPPGFQDDDDCFCCCSHIVPSSHFMADAEAHAVSSTAVLCESQIDQYPRSLFHPPRS